MTGSRGPLPKPTALRVLEGNAGKRPLDLAAGINPRIEMIGVEAALYPSMHHAIRNLTPTFGAPTIAEGIAVKSPGALTKAINDRRERANASEPAGAERGDGAPRASA